MQVYLNVYDVPGGNEQMDSVIQRLNEWGRLAGFGGVFHGAVELDGREWSFGGCPSGSGVYGFEPKRNPMYKFRETVDLGTTNKSKQEVKQILRRLKGEWSGPSYELLSRNCCHFCETFAQELEVQPVPGWLNRAAVSADAAVTFSNKAYSVGSTVGSNISRTATTSYGWLCNSISGMLQQQQQQQEQQEQDDFQEELPEGAGESFMRHFSFMGGSAKGIKKPAKAIWEGGLSHGSPLHAALAQHPRVPSHSGIAHLPSHLRSHTADGMSIDGTSPLGVASLPPEPQAPPDRTAAGGVGTRGAGADMQRPHSVPSVGSSMDQERPRSAAWLRERLAGGLQTAAAATAAAASAPSSWFAKDSVQGGQDAASSFPNPLQASSSWFAKESVQGGQNAASPPPFHGAPTAGDASTCGNGASISHTEGVSSSHGASIFQALGSTCRPGTISHSHSSSDSSSSADAGEEGTEDGVMSSGLPHGVGASGGGGAKHVLGTSNESVHEQSEEVVGPGAGHAVGLDNFTSVTKSEQQQQQQQQQHMQEESDLLGLEVQSEHKASFKQEPQQQQQQQQQLLPWSRTCPPVCPKQAASGQTNQEAKRELISWDESNLGASTLGGASALKLPTTYPSLI